MKKNYIITLFILCGWSISAQSLVYPTGMHYDEHLIDIYQNFDVQVTTVNPEQITFEWETISNTLPAGWDVSICDYTNCYSGIPASSLMTEITLVNAQNGVHGFLKLNVGHQGVFGEGTLKIYVHDVMDNNRGDTISYHLTYWDPLSVEDKNNVSFDVSPNPASEFVSISSEGQYHVSIINSLGVEVQALEGNNTTNLDISSLRSGLYFVSISNANGAIKSKRLIVR